MEEQASSNHIEKVMNLIVTLVAISVLTRSQASQIYDL
jgi:hypothetical protein